MFLLNPLANTNIQNSSNRLSSPSITCAVDPFSPPPPQFGGSCCSCQSVAPSLSFSRCCRPIPSLFAFLSSEAAAALPTFPFLLALSVTLSVSGCCSSDSFCSLSPHAWNRKPPKHFIERHDLLATMNCYSSQVPIHKVVFLTKAS